VAEEQNFTRAAERIGMAQPPLSQQIMTLERQLQAPLFKRSRRKVELTEAGEALLVHARRILSAVGDARDAVQAASAGRSGTIKLGAMYSVVHSLVPAVLRTSREMDPGLTIEVQELTVAQQHRALNEGAIDLAIIRDRVDEPHLSSLQLFEEPFVVALPCAMNLKKDESLKAAWLFRQSYVSMSSKCNPGYAAQLRQFAVSMGGQFDVVQEASDMHTLLCLVAAGIGIAIVPFSVARTPINDVAYHRITSPAPSTWVSLAWRKDNGSPVLPSLISRIEALAAAERDMRLHLLAADERQAAA